MPLNDDLVDAARVTDLPFRDELSTEWASDEVDEAGSRCMVPVQGVVGRGVWSRFEPPSSGKVRSTRIGSEFDSIVSVWQGQLGHPLEELACNDDAVGKWSRLVFEFEDGRTYFVKAGGQAGDAGYLVVTADPATVSDEAGVFFPYLARLAPIQ